MQSGQIADKPLGYFRVAAAGYDTAKTLAQLIATAIPDGTYRVLIQPETQAARWRDDGTAPTTSIGMLLAVGATLDYQVGRLGALQMISGVAGGLLNLSFYGSGA